MRSTKKAFGSPIATRELSRTDTGGKVTIELGRPLRRGTHEFECPYRIRGLGHAKVGRAYGIDSVQALQLSFEAVRLELKPYADNLAWLGARGETGFPQFVSYSFGKAFTQRAERMLDRELERVSRRLAQRAIGKGGRLRQRRTREPSN